jgi:hypothetical protein
MERVRMQNRGTDSEEPRQCMKDEVKRVVPLAKDCERRTRDTELDGEEASIARLLERKNNDIFLFLPIQNELKCLLELL